MLFKRYFAYVSLVESVIVNSILGLLSSFVSLCGFWIFLGGFSNHPTLENLFGGCIAILIVICAFLVTNYIMYRVSGKLRKVSLEPLNRKQLFLRTVIVAVIFLCTAFSPYLLLLEADWWWEYIPSLFAII